MDLLYTAFCKRYQLDYCKENLNDDGNTQILGSYAE